MNHVLENLNDQGHRPIIITTNYDVLCEIGITSGNPHWQYYYPGFRLPWTPTEKNQSVLEENVNIGIESLLGMKAVPIIKLHGSINWFQGGKGNTSLFATTEFGHYDKKFSNLIGLSRPEFEIKYIKGWMGAIGLVGSDPVPAIIPPMLGKMSISPIISRQWQSAIRCLETAADITVIGYSFPETDTFMTRLLAEGLKNNNGLEQITIVDIQDEGQWAERLERIFATTLRKTKLKFQMSDSKKYLISLAKKRGNEGTAVVITSPSY
jgi:hypothetical protein